MLGRTAPFSGVFAAPTCSNPRGARVGVGGEGMGGGTRGINGRFR